MQLSKHLSIFWTKWKKWIKVLWLKNTSIYKSLCCQSIPTLLSTLINPIGRGHSGDMPGNCGMIGNVCSRWKMRQGHKTNNMSLHCAVLSSFSRVQLCDRMDCGPPGSYVHGILQAKVLVWVAIKCWYFTHHRYFALIFKDIALKYLSQLWHFLVPLKYFSQGDSTQLRLSHLNLIPGKTRCWSELPRTPFPRVVALLSFFKQSPVGEWIPEAFCGSQMSPSCMPTQLWECLIFSAEILNHKAAIMETVPLYGKHTMVTCLQRCLETPDILHPALVTSDPKPQVSNSYPGTLIRARDIRVPRLSKH